MVTNKMPFVRMTVSAGITVAVWEKVNEDGIIWLSVCLRIEGKDGKQDTPLFVSDLQERPRKDDKDVWADVPTKVKDAVIKQAQKRLIPFLAEKYPDIIYATQEV